MSTSLNASATLRGAHRADIVLAQLDSFSGQAVDGRGADRRVVAGEIAPAEVVAHDEDDVGPIRRQGDHRQPQKTNQQSSHVMVSSATAG